MTIPTNSKVVLITGCSTGIGRALAIELSKLGHTVFAGARNISSLDNDRSDLLIPLTLDINDAEHINEAVNHIQAKSGRLDILVNNAGYGAMGPLIEMSMDQIRNQFETNVFSQLNMSQKMLPLLQAGKQPLIINIGSAAGITPIPFSGAYCASKSAMHTLSDVLRMELQPLGIHCMTVYPGGVASEFGANASNKLSDTLIKDSLYKEVVSAIESRATLSSSSPTTPQSFAHELIDTIFQSGPFRSKQAQPKFKANKRIGYGSNILPFMKWFIPTRVREKILQKKYHLNKI
jgi:NAD(P)-dependent dehydrogenase (short-subunit alcohol dehydrogenase family)